MTALKPVKIRHTIANTNRHDMIDYAIKFFKLEEYRHAVNHIATLWAFYRDEERLEQMDLCDVIMSRYNFTQRTLGDLHYFGMRKANEIKDMQKTSYRERLLEEILKGTN